MKKSISILLVLLMLLSLAACGQSSGEAAPGEVIEEEIPELSYSVSVADPDGNPIPGVTVQFCDELSCRTADTDESGAAVFTAKEGNYTVHILKVPEGFIGTEEEFPFQAGGEALDIVLEILKPAIDEPLIGFSYYTPEKYESINGIISWYPDRITDRIYEISPQYYVSYYSGIALPLFDFLCVLADEDAETYLRENVRPDTGWDGFTLEEVGSVEGMTCFLAQQELSEEAYAALQEYLGDSYEEYISLLEDRETFFSGIRLSKPTGTNFLFETQDMDGNAVSMSEVLSGHKVTMINFWATWCGPCVQELPQLQELSRTFEGKDCQIIGVCTDLHAGSDAAEAKDILSDNGVSYLNVVAPENDSHFYLLNAYPTSYFVDSEGNILTDPIVGASPSAYSKALTEALAALEG